MENGEGKGIKQMATYDDCSYCGGRVTEKAIQKPCFWGEKLFALVDNVPAGVCDQCGEKFYKANVLKIIEKLLKERKFASHVDLPLTDFSKAAENYK